LLEPAVPVRSSIKPDYLVSLIDGRKYKTLKRHLATHGLTPDTYRARYGLKLDYPMVAANLLRSAAGLPKRSGLAARALLVLMLLVKQLPFPQRRRKQRTPPIAAAREIRIGSGGSRR
jgi:hypothetical protein